MIDNVILGFQTALTPQNLLWCFVGVLAGTVIGLLPGLGSTTGVAVLLPLTLDFEPVTALIMLAGIYYGAQYGGTITSVLISTPGEASSVVTTLDGYQMARRGRAGAALSIAAIGSFVAAIFSLVLLMVLAPPFANFALKFGPVENLSIMILGLATIVSFSGESRIRGFAMASAGLLLATVGMDAATGTARFTFDNVNLLSGVPFVEVMIGLFAVGEVMYQIRVGAAAPIRTRFRELLITRSELRRSIGPIGRGSVLGFLLGCLPGSGSTLASFIAYGVEKRVSRNRSQLGQGAIEGVASPESANNAAANANFVPTLTLGIPGGGTTAVLLGAFTMYGLQPGPLLFQSQPTLVWGLLVSFFIGNVMLLVLNLPMAPIFAQMLRIPYAYLYPIILFTSFVGAYSIDNNMFSVWIVFVAGVAGYFMKLYDLPMAPLVLGLVIGPLFEKALTQTSALGDGDLLIVLSHPIALVVLALAVLLAAGPSLVRLLPRNTPARDREPAGV
ncbi:putative tricarboxylic transport membrane protein [Micromonospora kangleipakensis]|uniref:Putative tricarboxylic transport membrane protein n=1 Tax=Micromonospora kangleipakensis TaxID=1077942 RepID=A0A4Q8BFQ0_9ACTN|nr:tripartite tricarboxylate transporter permease [Micromonospora kangleipakensis]RZU76800.1 putative tricarboxylic transport membrane protein [Micromonospora kangleipakensis]